MISRRTLLGTLIGSPLVCLAVPVKAAELTEPDNQKIKDVTDVLCNGFFEHFIYTEYPRQVGPGVGNNVVFGFEFIPTKHWEGSIGDLTGHYGFHRFQGANDCLVKAGIKAIYTVMVEARSCEDGILILYSVIQTKELPPVDVDTIYRSTIGYDE